MPLVSAGVIFTTVFLTSFVSGIFGMAGGLILMGVLVSLVGVASAMIIHGVIQMFANAKFGDISASGHRYFRVSSGAPGVHCSSSPLQHSGTRFPAMACNTTKISLKIMAASTPI